MSRWRSASSNVWANNDVCLGSHFLALPFFLAQARVYFLGVDVRPVILDAACYIASAYDGAPCTKGQPPSALFQKTCENCTVTNNLA